jgi:hypothetical protein
MESLYWAFVGEGDEDFSEGIMSRAMQLHDLSEWIAAVVKGMRHPERAYIRIYAEAV